MNDSRPTAQRKIEHLERYKDFSIRATSIDDRHWEAEIFKTDGSRLMIVFPGHGVRPSYKTTVAGHTLEIAIQNAKEVIDGGAMK